MKFAPPRLWRADYLWRAPMLIVEREGGLFSKNVQAQLSHAAPTHILRDMEKSNAAQLLGYANAIPLADGLAIAMPWYIRFLSQRRVPVEAEMATRPA